MTDIRDYEIIDVHVHLSRTTKQERLAYGKPGAMDRWLWGTPDNLSPYMDWLGISRVVTLNVIGARALLRRAGHDTSRTGPESYSDVETDAVMKVRERIERFNDWAVQTQLSNPRVIASVYADPVVHGIDGAIREVTRGAAAGAKGVKMHPILAGFAPNERWIWPLYDCVQHLDLPLTTDTGASWFRGAAEFGEPRLLADVLHDFPRLRVIAAHCASAYWDQRLALAECFANLLFDTAGGFGSSRAHARGGRRAADESDALRIIMGLGIQRVMFGSDGPADDPFPQLLQLGRLGLKDDEYAAILAGNARRVFAIDES